MFDTVFMHRRRALNIGDLFCSPGLYLDFGHHTFVDFSDPVPPCRLLVLGGGQVFQHCVSAVIRLAEHPCKKVVWGVGISAKDRASVDYDILRSGCAAVSTRNAGVGRCRYVPCVSALSPLFDAAPAPEHDVVIFYHSQKTPDNALEPGVPSLGNHQTDMAKAIRFIGSGATVVTNSYHGTYWAMCLGRRVLCLPFGGKFNHFIDPPALSDWAHWRADLGSAREHPGALRQARKRNLAYAERLRAELGISPATAR